MKNLMTKFNVYSDMHFWIKKTEGEIKIISINQDLQTRKWFVLFDEI